MLRCLPKEAQKLNGGPEIRTHRSLVFIAELQCLPMGYLPRANIGDSGAFCSLLLGTVPTRACPQIATRTPIRSGVPNTMSRV